MDYKEFEKHILRIQAAYDKDQALADILAVEGIVVLCDDLLESVVELLELEFEDSEGWIAYWIWELDFGKEYKPGSVRVGGEDVTLSTIKYLYDFLTKD